MTEVNCITLVNQLCEALVPVDKISEGDLKRLKLRMVSEIFSPRPDKANTEEEINEPCSLLKSELLLSAIKNHCKERNYEEKVEKMYDFVEQVKLNCDDVELQNIFLFLSSLADQNTETIFKNKSKIIPVSKNNKLYSEIIEYKGMDWEIFHKDPSSIISSSYEHPFYKEPGQNIPLLSDDIDNLKSFFSGKTELYSNIYKVWRFDVNEKVEQTVQDEGFITPGSDFSESDSINEDTESREDRLSEVDFDPNSIKPLKRSWDRLGDYEQFDEPPFCSESSDSIIHFWKIANSNPVKGLTPSPIGMEISFETLITDISYLLFGVGSSSFYFDKEMQLFQIRHRLHTKSLSPELLEEACKSFLKCANCYHSLKTFADKRQQMPFGCIHHVFCKCIQQILNMYKYSLLKIKWDYVRYLTHLQTLVTPLERKLSFVTNFCLISFKGKVTGSSFPSGIQLLDYLYGNLAKVSGNDLGYLLFYMFECCCNAYLRIVSEWIFDGCFSNPDNYMEFFIEIKREYEMCRDWRRVSCIGVKDKKIPKFLEKFYKEIFICGKSLNLLKICSSQETLDRLINKNHPKLVCCFNKQQIHEYIEEWRTYKSSCQGHLSSGIKIRDKLIGRCDNFEIKRAHDIQLAQKKEKSELISIDVETNTEIKTTPESISNEIKLETEIKTAPESESPELNTVEIKSQSESEIKENFVEAQKELQSNETSNELNNQIPTSQNSSPENGSLNETTSNSDPPQITVKIAFSKGEPSEECFGDYIPKNTPSKLDITKHHQGAGDCVKSENKKVKQLISDIENKLKTPPKNMGGGDAPDVLKEISNVQVNEYARNKVKAMSSRFSLSLDEALNKEKTPTHLADAVSDSFPKSKQLSALQENKLKVMSSRLSMTAHEDTPKPEKTKLSICDENKLKIMSSELHNRLNETGSPPPLKKDKTRLSVSEENKLKVMSSEFHLRLNESQSQSVAKPEPQKPVILSALQENKLKVMHSEYHHRLNTPISEKSIVVEKPLTESDRNKLKVMSSEYHTRLQNLSYNSDTPKETSEVKRELSECERNKLKVMSSEYHNRLTLSKTEKLLSSEISPDPKEDHQENVPNECSFLDIETENKVTADPNPSAFTDETKKGDEEWENDKKVHFNEAKEFIEPSSKDDIFPQNLVNFTFQSLSDVKFDSISDVDTTSLVYYLFQSIDIPLKIQLKLVNEAILRVFIEEQCYLDHLISLREYLLLRRPEFALSLTNSIFKLMDKTKKPYTLLNNYNLSVILQRALLSTGSRETLTYGKKLSLVADDNVPASFTMENIEELNCLNMTYSIKWPINILITDPILKKYSRLFRLLIQIQRVLWTLKKDFISLKNLKTGKSIQYTKIQIYRHNMTQIVKILQEHIMREAIETCWNEFVDDLAINEIDLDVLYMSHLKYLNKTMQRCFLCDQSSGCLRSILNMFSSILKYHEALKAGVWRRNVEVNFLYHTNFKNIDLIFDEFIKSFNDVRCNLRTLVYSQQKIYFESLYLELSKNFQGE